MGGAIGTGLFLGSAHIIESAGPSIILGYMIGGLIAFLIMRQLGEMIVHEPVTGSFSYFAFKYGSLHFSVKIVTIWTHPWDNPHMSATKKADK